MRSPLAFVAVASTTALIGAGCGGSTSTTKSTTATTGATSASSPSTGGQSGYGSHSTPAQGSSTAAASSQGSAGVVLVSKHSKDGTILAAGPKRLTVYLFEGDHGSSSSCSGACAQVWPPVTTAGAPVAAAGAVSAHLGTITRADGTTQVTYNGHPLYFFAKDGDSGDAYGQGVRGFGASWYVLKPSGQKVDNS